jgi:glycosyltransferase involved in cell wall biosynthesis
MSRFLLQICIPVYNAARYVDTLFNALLKINNDTIAFCFVDDGSTDNSTDLIQKFIENSNNNNNIFLKSQNNQGVSAARNAAITMTDADYIWFVDSDDEIIANNFQYLITKLKQGKDYVAISYLEELHNGNYIHRIFKHQFLSVSSYLTSCFVGAAWIAIFKKSLIKDIQFEKSITLGEDQFFHLKVLSSGVSLVEFINQPILVYAYNDQSLTRKFVVERYQRSLHFYQNALVNGVFKELPYNRVLLRVFVFLHYEFLSRYDSTFLYKIPLLRPYVYFEVFSFTKRGKKMLFSYLIHRFKNFVSLRSIQVLPFKLK